MCIHIYIYIYIYNGLNEPVPLGARALPRHLRREAGSALCEENNITNV